MVCRTWEMVPPWMVLLGSFVTPWWTTAIFYRQYDRLLELGNRDSGDQLKWTTAFLRKEVVAEYIVGSSYELPEVVLQYCVSSV